MRGWERSVDPSTGREFWLNHATHETSWTPPAESASSLPPGWEERKDVIEPVKLFSTDGTVTGEHRYEDASMPKD